MTCSYFRGLVAAAMIVCIGLFHATRVEATAPPMVLTGNAAKDEPVWPLDVTYSAKPAFTNPSDTDERRLLDGDNEGGNWRDVVGINKPEQTVTFDFAEPYRFDRFALKFTKGRLPKRVTVSVTDAADGPWQRVGVIEPGGETGWHGVDPSDSVTARHVRLHFEIDEWGWYVNEFKAWGWDADEPGPDAEMPHLRRDGELVIVDDGEPAASIIVGADPSAEAMKYARFLQQSLERMTGALLPVRTNAKDWAGTQILIGPEAAGDAAFPQGLDEPGGYRIRVGDRQIVLAGNEAADPDATGWAVYDLLEQLGFGWFGPDELYHVVPEAKTVALAPMDRREIPDFEHRNIWNTHHHTRLAWRLGGRAARSAHNLGRIVPASMFEEHPEYFALVDGERIKGGQRNLSHPDVQRMAIEYARNYAERHPRARSIPLGQNDTGGYDQSPATKKMGPNTSARFLEFCNIVARAIRKDYPDKLVTMWAYWHTYQPPPKGFKAEPNVMVMVVNQACHAHAIDDPDCPVNAGFRKNFFGWKKTGAQLGIREWYIPGYKKQNWDHLPWIQTEVIARNVRFWKKHGVNWINIEADYEDKQTGGYPLRWPLYYVASEMMWDVQQDPGALLDEACVKLYGEQAGETMSRYFQVLAYAMRSSEKHGSVWNLAPAESVFRPDVVSQARQLLDDALAAAEGGTVAHERLVKEAATWARAEQELEQLPNAPRHMVDARPYNGNIWFTPKGTVTGEYLMSLVGITDPHHVTVQEGGKQPQPFDVDQEYDASAGLTVMSIAGKRKPDPS